MRVWSDDSAMATSLARFGRQRFGVDEHREQKCALAPAIRPRVIGPALHHHIERLERDLALFEDERDLALEQDDVVDGARGMHAGTARGIGPAMLAAHRFESRRRALFQLLG